MRDRDNSQRSHHLTARIISLCTLLSIILPPQTNIASFFPSLLIIISATMKLGFVLVGGLLASTSAFRVQSTLRVLPRSPACPPLAAFVDIDENTGRDIGSMDEWATMCQVQRSEGFQLTSEDGVDWSVMTTEPLPGGSPVLYVPSEMILSSTRAREELGGSAEAAVEMLGRLDAADQIPQFYLFIKILTEYEMGDQSPWFPWLNSLPRSFYTGASMTRKNAVELIDAMLPLKCLKHSRFCRFVYSDACYECLPPLVSSLAMAERKENINFGEALQLVDCLSAETKRNKDLAKWAFNVVLTRSFGTDGEQRIAPMADMVRTVRSILFGPCLAVYIEITYIV